MNLVVAYRDLLEKRNYVRKADPRVNYWFDFAAGKVSEYLERYGPNFNLIIVGSLDFEADFYVIPYAAIRELLTEENLSNDKSGKRRWIGNIYGHTFKLSNCPKTKDISIFYGNPLLLADDHSPFLERSSILQDERSIPWKPRDLTEEEENEYAIENRLQEVKVRQKQSTFRRKVLTNFENRCCLTQVTEENLLRASHIVPWSHRVESRLDPSNGLCLSVVHDHLFDQGFIGFDEQLKVIITPEHREFSEPLQRILQSVVSKQAIPPKIHRINQEYLAYHREKILISA